MSKPNSSETDYGFNGIKNILNKHDINYDSWIARKIDKERGGIELYTPNVEGEIYLTWGDIYYVDIKFVNQDKEFKSTVNPNELENIIIEIEKMRKNYVKQMSEMLKSKFSEEE
tara:strand:- start:266 stop:607 length:342 start_codon:yes stop_codon:yes gene_type:complete